MNFAERTRDDATFLPWRRRAFPFFEHKICLTHASVSPLPRVVAEAVSEYSLRIMHEGQFDSVHDDIYRRCKERVARLIGSGAVPDEVAFCGSTSHAIGTVATGIQWQSGDNCVVADGDFPANVVPWKNLQHRHDIAVRMIPFRPRMNITLDDIKPLVDERTRIVSLASANFLTGYPLDLNQIGAWLHERGVLFCVDAIQTLGAIRFDATHVDFVCADAHKWLLGPNGIAILWSRRGALEQLHPALLGWLAPQNREDWFSYDTTPIDNAERFEPGARNYLGVVALDAALALHEEVGAQWVEERVTNLRDHAARVLAERGCPLLWHPAPNLPGGIVSFQAPDGATAALYKQLDERFALSLRQAKDGAEWIRVSAHWMNTTSDIDALAAQI
ncbi:MAG TPA: aminotransferase class V-fold PLP-dependent enzyme [Abditibacteriaceae bacterium]|jgi:selenocysteine lyase/cysteine desulfurase